MFNIRIITILSSLALVTGCAEWGLFQDYDKSSPFSSVSLSDVYPSMPSTVPMPEPITMEENSKELVKTGASINAALTGIDRLERYRKARIIKVVDENMAKYGLGDRVFIDWTGPVEPLLQEIADYTDYKFKVLGIAPAMPIIVTSAHNNIEIGDIITEAHLQSRERADVVVYPKSKTIELRYFELG